MAPGPLILSMALTQDDRAATTAADLDRLGEVGMIVNDGPTRLGGVSTIVRVDADAWSIVRPGVVDARTLTRMAGRIVLFVCTGNTCRSPMAEALCKVALAGRLGCHPDELEDRGFVILSAGMAASPGMPAAANAIEVLRAEGGRSPGTSAARSRPT